MPLSAELGVSARASGRPKVALAVDLYDWHARDLTAAFARAGFTAVPIRLAHCGFETKRPSGLLIPGFGADLPRLVFVRAIGSGTFESITLRLGVLHSLAALGVPVVNSARAVELCVDKAATSFALAFNLIPTPPTWTVQSEQAARQIVRREAARGPLVLKPLFGAQGFGLKLIRREEDLPPFEAVEGVYYLQRFVAVERDGFRDIRLFVSHGKVIASMTRHASHWITNVKLGATPEPFEPDARMIDLALRSAAAVEANFAGVDMIRDAAGHVHVIEVNSMPGWRGLQKITPFSIADRLVADLMPRLQPREAKASL